MTFVLTAGQRHESTVIEALLDGGKVRRRRGRPRHRPRRLVGDKGYSYPSVRRKITRRGIAHTIPRRIDQGQDPKFDRAIYRQRNRVERLFAQLKQFRRIATRYEKRAHNFLAMLTIAAIRLWL